jgi:hypothetical protein
MRACLSRPTLAYRRPRPKVTVGEKRTHAEFLRQRVSLTVIGFGWLNLRGITRGSNLTEEVPTSGLRASLTPLTAEYQQPLGRGVCVIRSAGSEVGLAQVSEPLGLPASFDSPSAFNRLLEGWQGLGQSPRHDIRKAQCASGHGVPGG